MNILVINSGSSSIKYQLIDTAEESVLASGLVERIGEESGAISNTSFPGTDKELKTKLELPIPDHTMGMKKAIELVTDKEKGAVSHTDEIDAVGHRIVHGGEHFHEPTLVTDTVIEAIEASIPFAPLHNPAHLAGIRTAMELFPKVPQVTVFDTAFHQTMPPHAYMYALPYELYEKDRIRRYGFHGTSHKYVAGICAEMLGKSLEECDLITVHLGNGCSMAAVKQGKCVDTSMGVTPLEGLVMGTRSGDVDPALHAFLGREKGMDVIEIDKLLNKQSGLKGLCGLNDMRDIHAAIAEGNEQAKIALDVQTYRNKKYISAYMGVLGGADAVVFTAGIGENDDVVRLRSVEGLEALGIKIDPAANQGRVKEPRVVSTPDSAVKIMVIPTNEELAIARETESVLNRHK